MKVLQRSTAAKSELQAARRDAMSLENNVRDLQEKLPPLSKSHARWVWRFIAAAVAAIVVIVLVKEVL
jgi:hypothetical protein